MNYINYFEAREDAERLSRVLNRSVEVERVNCDCDYSRLCYRCGGEGAYYELRFGFCNHLVHDDNDDECERNYCREQEIVRAEMKLEETFACVGKQIKSCGERASEESEAAA